jgi:hypothetical protein
VCCVCVRLCDCEAMHACNLRVHTYTSLSLNTYKEEDTCVSYEEEDASYTSLSLNTNTHALSLFTLL